MVIQENVIEVKDYLTKSNLPSSTYVINPYVGCPHGCKYCYASFMKRFTGHKEEWGTFIDIKQCSKKISLKKIENETVFLSSVTDCYNPYEAKYQVTRKILEQLLLSNCSLNISTKSSLILRDLDLLTQFSNLAVSVSLNTLDDDFRRDMDHADSVEERLKTLKILHENGIYTILFMSPIFPYLTDFKAIIEISREYVDEYWFENLNLRGSYRSVVLSYIEKKYPNLFPFYIDIYQKKDKEYWENLSREINQYCEKNHLIYKNYFYHEELVKKHRV